MQEDRRDNELAYTLELFTKYPETFIQKYYLSADAVIRDKDNDEFYLLGGTQTLLLTVKKKNPIFSIAYPNESIREDKVSLGSFRAFLIPTYPEDKIEKLNQLPYVVLPARTNTHLMITTSLSGCTLCCWQHPDGNMLVTHVQPTKPPGAGYENRAEELQTELERNGMFNQHPESKGKIIFFGPRHYRLERTLEATVVGWLTDDNKWNIIAQLNNPDGYVDRVTHIMDQTWSIEASKKESTQEHPYKISEEAWNVEVNIKKSSEDHRKVFNPIETAQTHDKEEEKEKEQPLYKKPDFGHF